MDGREERKVNFREGKGCEYVRTCVRAYVREVGGREKEGGGGLLCLIQDSRVVSRYGIDRQITTE